MTLGDKVRYFRELRALTQDELARMIHIPSYAISRIEHNDRKISLEEALRLAEALDIAITDLVEGLPWRKPRKGTASAPDVTQKGTTQELMRALEDSLWTVEPEARARYMDMMHLFLALLRGHSGNALAENVAHSRGIPVTI